MDKTSKINFSKLKLSFVLTLVGITLLAAGIYFTLYKNTKEDIKFTTEQTASSSGEIFIHLSGAVNKPGVYKMKIGSRIDDLIKEAGGFTNEVNKEYIEKTLNLVQNLKDGVKIYIPKIGDTGQGQVAGSITSRININSAPLSELDQLSDIGPVRAQKIIENRPYTTIEELVEKKIITQTIFEKIKEKISVY